MKKVLFLYLIAFLILTINVFAQKNSSSERIFPGSQVLDLDKFRKINVSNSTIKNNIQGNVSVAQDTANIVTEDFEGTFPTGLWNIYAQQDFTDAYWGIEQVASNNKAAWCAGSGTQAIIYGTGYANSMKSWMVYGPFDLTDASWAALNFYYYNSCEPGVDKFWWLASEDGINFSGFFLSDTSATSQFQFQSFDLTNVPTLGNLTGKSGIYIAFLFQSSESISNYWGAIVDNISLRKVAASSFTAVTNSPTNITSNSVTLNGTVNPDNLSTDVKFEYGTTTAYGSQITAAPGNISGTSDVNVSANLTGLQSNTIYHYRVNASNSGGTITGADLTFTTGVNYPVSITLAHTFSFTDLTQKSYRMVGLPGDQLTHISNLITGTPKKDWDAYFDNGAAGSSSDFLVEFNGTSTFDFAPGNGFWILSKNPFSVSGSPNNVKLSADNTYSIPLNSGTSGFIMISNPFIKTVSWADVQNLNGLTSNDHLFDWTGVWNTNAAQMEPYKAYYFKNTNNLNVLKIPYNFTAAKITASNSQEAETYSGNYVKLSLYQDDRENSFVVAGFNTSAKEDYDKFDCFAPPGYFDEVRIHIEDQNITDPYKQLFVDYRPSVNEGQSFDLKVKNESKKTIRLLAGGVEKFTSEQVYLFDENLNRFYNLKEKNEIDISPIHKNYNYRLLIGNENYINNIKKEYVPSEYSLYQNYPNPFNPSTVIKYQIPVNNTFVELKIYNVLGKEIKSLVNEIQDSGIHEVEFNAAGYSSGIYFCTLKALPNGQSVSFSSTKKMILIK